jgi:hypothetical protein
MTLASGVIMLAVIMRSVVLIVVRLSVVMLNVVRLNVVAPSFRPTIQFNLISAIASKLFLQKLNLI